MRFRTRLIIAVLPLVLLPLISGIAVSTYTAESRIRWLIRRNMELELNAFLNRCTEEYDILEELRIGKSEFYRMSAQENLYRYARERIINGGMLYILDPDREFPDILRYESHNYELLEAPFNPWGWTLGIAVSKQEFNAHTRESLLLSISILFLVSLALVVIVPVISRRISKPLESLRDQADRMSHGDMNSRVEIHGDTEIADLANSFNLMASHLESMKLSLESQVNDRTAELEASFDALNQARTELINRERFRTLGTVAAGLAHDISTPLGIGVTALSYLEETIREIDQLLDTESPEKELLKSKIATIDVSSRLATQNLDRVKELMQRFKRLSVDEGSEKKRVFELKSFIEDIEKGLESNLRNKAVILKAELDSLAINSYPGHFYQIFTNLIINSLIHGYPSGGPGLIVIGAELIGTQLNIEYRDDGVGMELPVLERAFDPFFTTRSDAGGSGLGMNIIYNSVTGGLGGSILIDSVPESGFTVKISIPLTG